MSSRLTVPKTITATPPQEDRNEDPFSVRCSKQFEIVRKNAEIGLQEIHQARIKLLRKELDYIKETNWKYSTIDNYKGQPHNFDF